MNEFTTWMQSNCMRWETSSASFVLPGCKHLVCAENPENDEGVPGAGRALLKLSGYGCDRRAAVAERRRRAIVRKCKPVLAYARGDTSCWSAGALRKRSGRWAVARHSLIVWLQTP